MRARLLSVTAAVAVVVLSTSPAYAAKGPRGAGAFSAPAGYDISYPQCNNAFPTNVAFGIVGVNDGIVFSPNPCLGTGDGPSELAWAQAAVNHQPAFYANTADPGPDYSSHWPAGQSTPQSCDGSNSTACSYDYGWNAAQDSFRDAASAEEQVNGTGASAAAAPWWLDVETNNSWETLESAYGQTTTSQQNDIAALQGELAYLQGVGVAQVGFYSTSSQWNQVTGGTGTTFAADPAWLAGYPSRSAAQNACTTATSFTGGRVALTQYRRSGFDADYAC